MHPAHTWSGRVSPDTLEALLAMIYLALILSSPLLIILNGGPWWLWHVPMVASGLALKYHSWFTGHVCAWLSRYQCWRVGRSYNDGGGTTAIALIGGFSCSALLTLLIDLMVLFPPS